MILDGICLLLLILLLIFGFHKGFVKVAFGVFSFFIAIMLAFSLEAPISSWMSETAVASRIEQSVYEHLVEKDAKELASSKDQEETFLEKTENITSEAMAEIRAEAAKKTTAMILQIISILVVIVLTKLLMVILAHLLNLAAKMPIIRQINCILGAAFGVLTGLFLLEIFFLLLNIGSMTAVGQTVMSWMDSSVFARTLYENNWIFHSFLSLE